MKNGFNFRFCRFFILFAACFLTTSCKKEDVYLYDQVGFKSQRPVGNSKNYPQGYNANYPPSSRIYKNPYNQPPQNYYPYYDQDYFYTLPNGYYGDEVDHEKDSKKPTSS